MNLSTYVAFYLRQRVRRHWVGFADTHTLPESFPLPDTLTEHITKALFDGNDSMVLARADLCGQLQVYHHWR